MAPADHERRRGRMWFALLAFLPAVAFVAVADARPLRESTTDSRTAKPNAASRCTRYAAPNGLEAGTGTRQRPYRTVARLIASLRPGDTGCLRPGIFAEDVIMARGGRAGRRITLRSASARRATIRGLLWIKDSANYVTVADLHLDGRNRFNLPSPIVHGDHVSFLGDDVTNHLQGESCFILGHPRAGAAVQIRIQRNRIHHCGADRAHGNHGIYVETVRGGVISQNYIYANRDNAISFYPDGDSLLIERNVLDGSIGSAPQGYGAGIMFGGDADRSGCMTSDNNVVRLNIISWNKNYGIDAWWGCGPGTNNLVVDNCFYANSGGPIRQRTSGFQQMSNRTANPGYRNRLRWDFRLAATSPCAQMSP